MTVVGHDALPGNRAAILTAVLSPAVLIFACYNVVNAGNLAFNMVFSRWMGPALFGDLAIILTVKLSILSVFAAIQMAVSRHVAATGRADDAALARFNGIGFAVLAALLPLLLVTIWRTDLGQSLDQHLGMSTSGLFFIISLAIPFALPLCLLRGVVQGRMDVGAVLTSALVEMAVRLFGAVVLWHLGAGITGVVVAIALSVVAGWAVIARHLSGPRPDVASSGTLIRTIMAACLPFAVLQLSQVLLLDAEVFVAKLLLAPIEAGYLAATSLFQRIEFFACFGLVSVLLPSVANAVAHGRTGLHEARPVALLFVAVTSVVLVAVWAMPDTLIRLMVGAAFLPARDFLMPAALAAAAFTFSFLVATFLAGQGRFVGIWMVAGCVPVQLGAFTILAVYADMPRAADLMSLKAGCQILLALLMAGVATRHLWRLRTAGAAARFCSQTSLIKE